MGYNLDGQRKDYYAHFTDRTGRDTYKSQWESMAEPGPNGSSLALWSNAFTIHV